MRLDDALNQIHRIRSQMEQTRLFRGYSWVATLFSAAMAGVAGIIQQVCIPDPDDHVDRYLQLWLSCGLLCAAVVAISLVRRYRNCDSPLDRELTVAAVQQFLPALFMGGLITCVLCLVAWQTLWIIPGLWCILFGMGLMASRPLLPRGISLVGSFYMLCGLCSIEWARLHVPFSPLSMVIPFGIGQTMTATILYWKLERKHASP